MQSTNNTIKSHICFDLDGTIIDSLKLMEFSWENATRQLAIQCEFSEYKKYIGLPFPVIAEKLGFAQVKNKLSDLYFSYNNQHIHLIKLNPDFLDLLSFFRDNNIGWSIITSKPRKNTEAILAHFKIDCSYLICPDDVTKGKPFADSILKLRKIAGIENDEILYVGDMLSDLQFATNSSISYVHFTKGIEREFNPNLVTDCSYISRLSDIKDLLQKKIAKI